MYRDIARTPRTARTPLVFVVLITLLASGLTAHSQIAPKPAEPATLKANAAVLKALPFANQQSFADAMRGFVGTVPDALVANPSVSATATATLPVWSMKPYAFQQAVDAPTTVNPSLWRHARLNAIHGLFKVSDRIYQVRGFDLANMTIVEGDTSLIIIDPLLTVETARAALNLYYQHRPAKPVGTVVYTHGHADHFGGIKGVTNEADVVGGKVKVLAPNGFMETAVAENILAGNAMSRRAQFQFGPLLRPGPQGQVDSGLGKNLARGTLSLIAPTETIDKATDDRVIDGIRIVFKLVPGSEAPAEMLMYFPQFKVLNMAEDLVPTMHNLYTLRGAEIRDGNLWSRYISEALEAFGDKTDVMIAQHMWPTFGQPRVQDQLKKHRDLYKFINDQTLRLLNHGMTPGEIADTLRLPASLEQEWSARGYYGTLKHNARGVYQKYLGWYDANPANLDPLPPMAHARKTIEYMGGAQAVIDKAKADFAKGEYRWVASAMNQVVFAEPTNRAARELGADALEQMGYQAEAATWRNVYLVGAQELRNGKPAGGLGSTATADTLQAVSNELFFDFLGVRLNGVKAEGKTMVINWNFTDSKELFVLTLENSALTHVAGKQSPAADASLTLARATLNAITLQETTFPQAMQAGLVKVQGDARKLGELLSMVDNFNPMFNVVEPKPAP